MFEAGGTSVLGWRNECLRLEERVLEAGGTSVGGWRNECWRNECWRMEE